MDMDLEQLTCRVKALEHENRELRSTIPCIVAHAERLEEIKRRTMEKGEDPSCEQQKAGSKCEEKAAASGGCERHKQQADCGGPKRCR